MLKRFTFFFFILYFSICWSQNGFQIANNKPKAVVPFKFVNNLIIIPVTVNGTPLNFLVDTGVKETLLFSLDETEQIKFENIKKIKFTGLGNAEPFDGLKSENNQLSLANFIDKNHTVYIVLDQEINISSQVGFPINGIIGYHFFKNHAVEINYSRKKITIYDSVTKFSKKRITTFSKIPISIEEDKPYIIANAQFETSEKISAKLLIDTGNSDALWLFKEKDNRIIVPKESFNDFLGKGFSGLIYGDRARIETFEIADFKFNKPLIAFPDSTATKGIDMVENRVGSIGSEIMKRFTVIFDYSNNQIFLKKNGNFETPFNFNMSGIDVQHEGLQWVKESVNNITNSGVSFDAAGEKTIPNFQFKFELKPAYSVLNIRKDSPAEIAGIQKNDIILKINGSNAYSYTLQEINEIFKSEEGKTIYIDVERNGKILKFKFQLKSII